MSKQELELPMDTLSRLSLNQNADAKGETLERIRKMEALYGVRHYKPSPDTLDDDYDPPCFEGIDLQGELTLPISFLIERLGLLGIGPELIASLFPEVDITQDSQTVISLSKARLVKVLRDLKIYEEDLFEQFHDLIPNFYDEMMNLGKRLSETKD
jgi:hypothetical protein